MRQQQLLTMEFFRATGPTFSVLLFLFTVTNNALAQLSPQDITEANGRLEKPNVIFILADDLAWGDLGCYGNQKIATPNLDRLADRGVLFTNFYASAPVCAPSRVGFFTGRYAEGSGAYYGEGGNQIDVPVSMPNLATTFKQAGYRTAHIGKWHLSPEKRPDQYGFDEYKIRETHSWGELQEDPHFRAHSTQYFVNDAIEFIEARSNDPFFVQLWTILPHDILFPTEQQMARYEQYDMRKKYDIPGFTFTSAEQVYYASVTALDDHLGKLFTYLDSTGLSKNTLMIFTSDNGPGIMESLQCGHSAAGNTGPFRGRKFSIYEGGIRMPLIVSLPGQIPEAMVDHQTVLGGIDFLPTLAALAGTEAPSPVDGQDMSQAWWGKATDREAPLFWRWHWKMPPQPYHRSPILATRSGEWKLLMNPDSSRVELYNVSTDPGELDNVATEHPQRTAEMQTDLLKWNKQLPVVKYEPEAGKNDYPWPGSKE